MLAPGLRARRASGARLALWMLGLAGATLAHGSIARAEPQASVGVTAGAVESNVASSQRALDLHLGLRADTLFGRSSDRDMGIGPYVDAATAGFSTYDVGGGLEWLAPLIPDAPFTLSAGAFARNGDGRSWAPGVEGALAVGSRSYNFHSWYDLAAGVFVQTRWVPEAPSTFDVVLGVQIDLELVAMPFVFLWEAVTHGG